MSTSRGLTNEPKTEYLSDLTGRFAHTQQMWGQLGIDVAAFVPGQTSLSLKVKDKEYVKGLGLHALGEIIIDLDGLYDTFEAEVGVQWQGGNVGSVVFEVYVDDEKRFDSDVMKETDPAKPLSISVAGAQDLRLVATDAGDGISCDLADWADARLTRSASPVIRTADDLVDVAQFGRVVTWDPSRMDGARASRIEEFHAEDLFLETDVVPGSNGLYTVPSHDGTGCIGLQWIEQRRIKEIGIELAEPRSIEGTQVQYWAGATLWQGEWKALNGSIEPVGNQWVIRIDKARNPDIGAGTRKVRWVFPKPSGRPVVKRLWAFTDSRWDDVELTVELEKPMPGQRGEIEIYNGALLDNTGVSTRRAWELKAPLRVKVRYSKSRPWKSDRTVIRLRLQGSAFGVAVDDLIAQDCVYVKEAGVFIVREPAKVTLKEYTRGIAGQKTILQRVREMPDQTLAQALAKTHNPIQDAGPTMLSLACDNRKFIVTREGAIQFSTQPDKADQPHWVPLKYNALVTATFGSGKSEGLKRHAEGGWLPVPVMEVPDGEVVYTERAGVFPFGEQNSPSGANWLNDKPLCVAEFTIENRDDKPANASLRLGFMADSEAQRPAKFIEAEQGVIAEDEGRLFAWLSPILTKEGPGEVSLMVAIEDGALVLTGTMGAKTTTACRLFLPAWDMKPDEYGQFAGVENLAARVKSYWEQALAPAMQFELPDPYMMNVIRASEVYCLIAARNEEDGARVAPWIASMSYGPLESESNSIIRGMCLMGFEEFTRRSLDYFIKRYNPAGFLTTGYTTMGTGWHLWSLGEYHDLYRDRAWMKRVAPEVDRVCKWITAQREKTKKLDGHGAKVPEYGLIPPGVLADWNAFSYHYSLEGYYYAGLKQAAEALADIGSPDAKPLLDNAAEFRKEILRAYEWSQSQMPVVPLRDGAWVQGYPAQVYTLGPTNDYFPGQDGNRSWCYDVELGASQIVPQGVLDPNGRDVDRMMDHMEDVQFLLEGWFDYPAAKSEADWFNLGGFAKVQPYYCRNAEISALRDDVKPFIRSYFNMLASLLNTETMWLWEHFRNAGAWNKTHETGYFLQQTRFMLVTEHEHELWLAPLITNNWMKDGMVFAVRNAPTRFGPVSYRITSHVAQGYIEAAIDPPTRGKPSAIVIRLRHPDGKRIKSVTVNGKRHASLNAEREIVRIKPGTGTLTIRAEF